MNMKIFLKLSVRLLVSIILSLFYLFLMYKVGTYLPAWLNWMSYPSFYILGGWAFAGLDDVLPEIIFWISTLTVIFFVLLTVIERVRLKKNSKRKRAEC